MLLSLLLLGEFVVRAVVLPVSHVLRSRQEACVGDEACFSVRELRR